MDEGKFVADFIAKNIEKIFELGKKAYGTLDETIQINLKTAYTNYLENSREKYSKSKSFFIRNQAVDLYSYYVPTGVSCGTTVFKKPSFEECIQHSQRIVITGTGGSGKSVLMRHLYLDCIKQKEYAPVLIELRDLNGEKQTLDTFIANTLELYGFNISGKYIERAKKEGHFCFFLDGHDEVDHSSRKDLIKQLLKLSNKYPLCPIFISSRPDQIFNGIEEFSIFSVLSLDVVSATNLIEKLPFDLEIKKKFIADLRNGLFEKHESFLSNPLLLSIMLLTYGENAEIPSKLSIFYNQAYEALFQRHDANKGGYSRTRLTHLDIQDFSRVFSLFALQTYERRLFKMPHTDCLNFISKARDSIHLEFKPEDYFNDLLSAACLLIEDGLEVAFSHRSFQEYFVALYISSASPEVQEKLINRYWKNNISDSVIDLLYELNPELVERVLILPRLEKLFTEIGVTRKVGITHGAKFIKRVYSALNVEDNTISAPYTENQEYESSIVHLVIQHNNAYTFPNEEYFKFFLEKIRSKYGKEGERVSYSTKKLNYKSPIMEDILNAKGAFSIEYLQSAFEAYKKLKEKHNKSASNLDELLGIR